MAGPMDMLLGKPPVEGVGTIWGKRTEPRRTEGTTDRTYALGLNLAVKADIEKLGHPTCADCGKTWPCVPCTLDRMKRKVTPITPDYVPDPDFACPELGELGDFAPNAWAGHGGRDNDRLIDAVKAATATVHNNHQPPQQDGRA